MIYYVNALRLDLPAKGTDMISRRLTVWDIITVAALLLLTGAAALSVSALRREKADRIVISGTDSGIESYQLGEDRRITVTGKGGRTLTVVISGGEAYVCDAECPGKDCEKTGRISNAGGTIVCVPLGIVIRAEGANAPGGEYDGLAG